MTRMEEKTFMKILKRSLSEIKVDLVVAVCAQKSIKRVNQTKCWTKGESDVDQQNLGETIDQKSKLPLQCFKLLVNIVSPFFWVWKMNSTDPIKTNY